MATTAIHPALTAREFIGIFKPRIAFAITLSALGGLAISPAPLPQLWQMIAVLLSVFLAAGSAGAFNQWAESDLDANMARTANRPFASGQINPGIDWLIGIVALLGVAVAIAAIATNMWAALYTFLGAFTYGIVYTLWLKRRTWLNIVVGGLAGTFAVLAGAAATDPVMAAEPILLAVVLFLWTPPHFWSLAMAMKEEYGHNHVPMLPNVAGEKISAQVIFAHTITLSLLSLVPVAYGMGWVYFAFALAGGALFTATSIRLVAEPTKKRAIQNFLASLMQLVLLITGVVLDRWLSGVLG